MAKYLFHASYSPEGLKGLQKETDKALAGTARYRGPGT
jgi:hypothetical protein